MTDELQQDRLEEVSDLSLETKLWRLSMIISAAGRIHSSLTLDRVLDSFLDIATGEVGANGGSVFLQEVEGEGLALKHSHWAGETGRPSWEHCSRLAKEAMRSGEMTEDNGEGDLGTIVTLPLRDESKVSIGVLQIYRNRDASLDSSDRLFLTELSHFASLSIRNAQFHQDSLTKAQLESEIGIARDIQVGTLPREMPLVPGYDVAGLSRPADETSGDSFDLIASDSDDLTILLADATGHGIGPALSVTQARSMLRVARRLEVDLDEILLNINNQLCEDLAPSRFVTAFFGQLEPGSHQLRYLSAGQAPLILFRAASGESQRLGATSPPLGIVPMKKVPAPQLIDMGPRDTLALITDGVYEAENAVGQEFGEEPVERILQETRDQTCEDVIREILREVDEHRGESPQADDITIVLLRRQS